MTPEERSKADAAVSKYLGYVEMRVREFRDYLSTDWNREPDLFVLRLQIDNLNFDLDRASENLEMEL
jgi:hypothetical protein